MDLWLTNLVLAVTEYITSEISEIWSTESRLITMRLESFGNVANQLRITQDLRMHK